MVRLIMQCICIVFAVWSDVLSARERNKDNPDIFAYIEWKFCALIMVIALWGLN